MAPASGQAGGYSVRVLHLVAKQTHTAASPIATVFTTDLKVRLPPGLLTSKESYAVIVSAYFAPGHDFGSAAFTARAAVDAARADFISGIWQAP